MRRVVSAWVVGSRREGGYQARTESERVGREGF